MVYASCVPLGANQRIKVDTSSGDPILKLTYTLDTNNKKTGEHTVSNSTELYSASPNMTYIVGFNHRKIARSRKYQRRTLKKLIWHPKGTYPRATLLWFRIVRNNYSGKIICTIEHEKHYFNPDNGWLEPQKRKFLVAPIASEGKEVCSQLEKQ
jgi:hypothetical protein